MRLIDTTTVQRHQGGLGRGERLAEMRQVCVERDTCRSVLIWVKRSVASWRLHDAQGSRWRATSAPRRQRYELDTNRRPIGLPAW